MAKAAKDRPDISDVIESIGYGLAQVRAVALGCSVWLADGCELLVISSVTNAVAEVWGFSQLEKSSVVTLVFIGIFLGNFYSGPLGDKYGRQRIIILSYCSIFVFNMASSFSWNYVSLAATRFIAGFSFGLGQPVWNALGSEITPTKWRVVNPCMLCMLFSVGEMYVAFLMLMDDPTMQDVHWRHLVRMASMPALFFGLGSILFLHESPRWLALQGRHEDARYVLQSMASSNGVPDVNVDYKPPEAAAQSASSGAGLDMSARLQIVFGPKYLWSTIITTYGVFVANLVYYGGLYAFAQILPSLDTGLSPAMEIFLGACWEMPGFMIAFVVCLSLRRIPVMVLSSFVVAMCMTGFGIGIVTDNRFLLDLGYYGVKFAGIPIFVVYYAYSTEIYPTKARSTGTAVVLAGGRFAGMISPILYEGIVATFNPASFFFFAGFLSVTNGLLAMTLPFETSTTKLVEDENEQMSDVAVKAPEARAPAYGSIKVV